MNRAELEAAWQAADERFACGSRLHQEGSRYSNGAVIGIWTSSALLALPVHLVTWAMPVIWSVVLASIIIWLTKEHQASKQMDLALSEQRVLLTLMRHGQVQD